MKHLKVANGRTLSTVTEERMPFYMLCYIYIDWGSCGGVDECGFDFGNCGNRDVCLVDY